MQRESVQQKKRMSMAELLRRKNSESARARANIPSTSRNPSSSTNDGDNEDSDNSSQNSDELEQMVQNVFNEAESNTNDEVVDPNEEILPCIYPELEPILWKVEKVLNSKEELDEFFAQEDC